MLGVKSLCCLLVTILVVGSVKTNKLIPDGYQFSYETDDGTKRQETGIVLQSPKEDFLKIKGSYSYILSDGRLLEVTYTADERGFIPNIKVQSPTTSKPLFPMFTLPPPPVFPIPVDEVVIPKPPQAIGSPIPGAAIATLTGGIG